MRRSTEGGEEGQLGEGRLRLPLTRPVLLRPTQPTLRARDEKGGAKIRSKRGRGLEKVPPLRDGKPHPGLSLPMRMRKGKRRGRRAYRKLRP